MVKCFYITYFLLFSSYFLTGENRVSILDYEFVELIKYYENPKKYGFNDNKWRPIKSYEGGTPTLAYGHKLTKEEYYSGKLYNGLSWKKGITDDQAEDLLLYDIFINIQKAENIFINFHNYPINVKRALVNSCFRGEVKLTKKWVQFINKNEWNSACLSYLDSREYIRAKKRYSGPGGLVERMEWNAEQFTTCINN